MQLYEFCFDSIEKGIVKNVLEVKETAKVFTYTEGWLKGCRLQKSEIATVSRNGARIILLEDDIKRAAKMLFEYRERQIKSYQSSIEHYEKGKEKLGEYLNE